MPRVAAARASAAAWLPDECAATPRAASSSPSDCTAFVAPRYLNAPMRCRCSHLRNSVAPAHASSVTLVITGVRCTNGAMRVAATRTSANDAMTTTPVHGASVPRGEDAFEEVVEAEQHERNGTTPASHVSGWRQRRNTHHHRGRPPRRSRPSTYAGPSGWVSPSSPSANVGDRTAESSPFPGMELRGVDRCRRFRGHEFGLHDQPLARRRTSGCTW